MRWLERQLLRRLARPALAPATQPRGRVPPRRRWNAKDRVKRCGRTGERDRLTDLAMFRGGSQPLSGLGQNRAHRRLGNPQLFADLAVVHVTKMIEAYHFRFALG